MATTVDMTAVEELVNQYQQAKEDESRHARDVELYRTNMLNAEAARVAANDHATMIMRELVKQLDKRTNDGQA